MQVFNVGIGLYIKLISSNWHKIIKMDLISNYNDKKFNNVSRFLDTDHEISKFITTKYF